MWLGTLSLSLILLTIFSFAVLPQLLRGNKRINCGYFSVSKEKNLWMILARNFLLCCLEFLFFCFGFSIVHILGANISSCNHQSFPIIIKKRGFMIELLIASPILSWIAISCLALSVLALAGQISILHERIGPHKSLVFPKWT
ncbi:hypothetical protein A7K93_02460 [Candidatus Methylacidiphilum fumarolicum]|nr:hypothetical protein A7K73_00745 [Candidatus Methylacidiphilum fumarolicum]TFE73525.1 hypothetical protein A7K72_06385 [Candidatus Methylacidiphilum fumarolicum]TFE75014.1 hypothetical protein A7K93_02460 [Candidatus Methylacidiphilum fumarolicum]TFE76559.1 hypothetical protein A7D33_09465 [Candidatus Methylacidiphilum fumarolicum]